jgi:hypothetical protein
MAAIRRSRIVAAEGLRCFLALRFAVFADFFGFVFLAMFSLQPGNDRFHYI